uniref:Uncharacterized protein n=1 Tax=Trichogramma kaykai TaxID=54128 RepID=A0ABD2VYH8_9HYME
MSRAKNKRSQKRHDKPGRPSKKQRAFNGGRKRLDIFEKIENVSEKTLYRRAEEFAAQCNNDVKFIELALKIARKKNGCDDSATIIETNKNEKCDGDSALSFSLDLDGDDQIEEFTSQAYLFVSCMNIIQMSCNLHGHDHCWVNPSPQSIRFTRPLRMSFEKEDDEAITKEIRSRSNRISDVFNKAIYLSDPKLSLIHVNKRMKFHKSRIVPEKIEEFLLSNNSSQVIEEMDTD